MTETKSKAGRKPKGEKAMTAAERNKAWHDRLRQAESDALDFALACDALASRDPDLAATFRGSRALMAVLRRVRARHTGSTTPWWIDTVSVDAE
jgi:hypothetical protein